MVAVRILFVRHGDPNYRDDCLTPLGHLQADAAGERLLGEPIDRIYCSTCGRALETAGHIVARMGIDFAQVQKLPFMEEIDWGSNDGAPLEMNGHPWMISDSMAQQGQSLLQDGWQENELFRRNIVGGFCQKVGDAFDALLETLGYTREGAFYRVGQPVCENVLLVSHAGSSTAVFARLFNLPLPFAFSFYRPAFTSVSSVTFAGEPGSLIAPTLSLLNDAKHIEGLRVENQFGN